MLTSNAIFGVDVDGLIPGVGVTNNATIDGTLNVNLGFAPSDGDTFAVENLPADFVVNYPAPLLGQRNR